MGLHIRHSLCKCSPSITRDIKCNDRMNDFVGSTNTIDISLILSTISFFLPVSGCVGKGLSALLCPGAYNAVKTALHVGSHRSSCEFDPVFHSNMQCVNQPQCNTLSKTIEKSHNMTYYGPRRRVIRCVSQDGSFRKP